jgi:hypothetical protein
MLPASPTPLTPRALSGLGVTTWTMRIGGVCSAVGIAYSSQDCVSGCACAS